MNLNLNDWEVNDLIYSSPQRRRGVLTSSLERAAQINMVAPVNEVFMINGTEMPELQAKKVTL